MLYEIKFYVYAYVINECCDNLFMMIACVEWLNWLNDNMIMYMYIWVDKWWLGCNDKYVVELWSDYDDDMLTYVWSNHVCISYLWMVSDDNNMYVFMELIENLWIGMNWLDYSNTLTWICIAITCNYVWDEFHECWWLVLC